MQDKPEFEPKYYFHVDWLNYTSTMLCEWELKCLEVVIDHRSSRFYNNVMETKEMIVSHYPKSTNNKPVSILVNKDYRNDFFEYGLPIDCAFTRIDFAIDCKTEREAKKYVTGKKYGVWDSVDGITQYYGNSRKSVIFERVYKKLDRGGVWRYEIEIKPRAGREHKTIFKKLHKDVLSFWNTVCGCMTQTGVNAETRDFEALAKKRQIYIDVHIESKYCTPTIEFYNELTEKEKRYFTNKLKFIEYERQQQWKTAINRG